MKAWVLDGPGSAAAHGKTRSGTGTRRGPGADRRVSICGTDVEIITKGLPAIVQGGSPFNKNFTPGHEYMGTIVKLGAGVDEYKIGDRVAVEIHAGCGRCERCRQGMYTSCLNYGLNYDGHDKGHRANGFTTDGGFAQYAVNHINTLVHVPDEMSDEEATLIVTAGTAMYGLDVLGGLIAGESLVVTGPGPDRPDGGRRRQGPRRRARHPHRDARLAAEPGTQTGRGPCRQHPQGKPRGGGEKDHRRQGGQLRPGVLRGGRTALNEAMDMIQRGGRICLAAFPGEPALVDLAKIVRNNIYLYGIRGEGKSATHRAAALMNQKKFDAKLMHTHTFPLEELPTAFKYCPRADRGCDQGGGQGVMRHSRNSVERFDLNR